MALHWGGESQNLMIHAKKSAGDGKTKKNPHRKPMGAMKKKKFQLE